MGVFLVSSFFTPASNELYTKVVILNRIMQIAPNTLHVGAIDLYMHTTLSAAATIK